MLDSSTASVIMDDSLTARASDLLFTPVNKDASAWSCNAFILGLALLYTVAFHSTYLTRWTEPKGADKFVEHPRAEWHNSIGSFVSAVLVVACALLCLNTFAAACPAGARMSF